MAYSTRTYTPGSSTTTFALTTSGGSPIGYIQESDIKVTVNSVVFTNAASGSNTYQITGTSTVEQPNGGNVVLNAGVTGTVVLERTTAIQSATVTYTAGSTLTASDLNNADNQIRFGLQEFSDDYAALLGTGNLTTLGSFLGGSDTWVSNDAKAATTSAIDGRIDTKATAKVKDDIIATAPVSIADDSPSAGKITVSVDAKLTELATMDQNTANSLADLTQAEVQILDGATLTTTELNYVDGVTSDIQTQLNAKQPLDSDLTTIAGLTATDNNVIIGNGSNQWSTESGATLRTSIGAQTQDADLDTLSGMQTGAAAKLAALTATEVETLDGITSTTSELNILDGVTSTATELNILDGVTASTGELNKLDGVTSTATNLNVVSGMTKATSLTINSDTEFPTSKAVADHVASSVSAVGGFDTCASEVTFPNTQLDAGVVLSIQDAGGMSISSTGVCSSPTTVGGTAVTITGIPNALKGGVGANPNPNVLAAGVGLQLLSSGSGQNYAYHKILATEADVAQLSGDINDFNERYRVSNGAPSGTDHAGDLYYDTGSDKMLVRNAANNAWEEVQSIGNFYISSFSQAFDGSRIDFTLANAPASAQQVVLSINGVVQKPNAGTSRPSEGFSLNGSTLQLPTGSGPAASTPYWVIVLGSSVNIGTPSAGTVDYSKLDVSNSGTNGQVLSKSGSTEGLTWVNADSAEVYGFNTNASGNLIVTTTNSGSDNISSSAYAAFEDVFFAATGFTFSINASGNLIATI